MTATHIQKELAAIATSERAQSSARFFKTGPGEYGEGDQFIGVSMPDQRTIAKAHQDISLNEVATLLASPVHEHRMVGLVILTYQYEIAYKQKNKDLMRTIYDFFVAHIDRVNNWDLVDVSVPKVIGLYLLDKDTNILYTWANSDSLWERRIAILATHPRIKKGDFVDIFKLTQLLLEDSHDLIHKACGWMLREAWSVDAKPVEKFIFEHKRAMPRTMLRYAIEKIDKKRRTTFMEL